MNQTTGSKDVTKLYQTFNQYQYNFQKQKRILIQLQKDRPQPKKNLQKVTVFIQIPTFKLLLLSTRVSRQRAPYFLENIFVGDLLATIDNDTLQKYQITHVLKVLCDEYTEKKHIEYLQIPVYDSLDEDLKKHFRISNRFVSQVMEKNGKVLIHDRNGLGPAVVFGLAYLINNLQIPLKIGLEIIQKQQIEPKLNQQYMSQLEQYDIEKLSNYRQSTESFSQN